MRGQVRAQRLRATAMHAQARHLAQLRSGMAVSYTHLDVYKRQAHTFTQHEIGHIGICLLYTSRCV